MVLKRRFKLFQIQTAMTKFKNLLQNVLQVLKLLKK